MASQLAHSKKEATALLKQMIHAKAREAARAERREAMAQANPKYILRNWMAMEAYEAAERGDTSVLEQVRSHRCPRRRKCLPP